MYTTAVARLLFVTGTPADVRGGSGTFVGITVLRRALESRGYEVEMLVPARGRSVSLTRRFLFNLGVRNSARRLRPDAVIGFDLDGLFVRSEGARRVASLKGVVADEALFERGAARVRLGVEASLERIHARRADIVVATSAYSASRVVAHYAVPSGRVRVVAEPIELDRWRRALDSAEAFPRQGPSILCVAHLYPRKEVATLLAAMTRLPGEAALRVAGDGPELNRLRTLTGRLGLTRRVEFLGHVSFARLAAEYRRADIFCLPSRQEGFGIVFLEAMAAGLPIVAARATAVPEVVADGECGILVPPGDESTLAAALERLLGDAIERRRLAEGGLLRVKRYDAPLVAALFLEAIGLPAIGTGATAKMP